MHHFVCPSVASAIRRRLAARQMVSGGREVRVLCVEEGALGVEFLTPGGRACIAEVLGPGMSYMLDVEGGEHASSWEPRLVVTALVPSTVTEIPLGHFVRELSRDPDLLVALTASRARQHNALLRRLAVLRMAQPMQRVAATLLYLGGRLGSACPLTGRVRMSITQDLIAASADLARQTTNASLRKLYRARIIHLERAMICLLDPVRLTRVASAETETLRAMKPSTCRLLHPDRPLDCVAIEPVPPRKAGSG